MGTNLQGNYIFQHGFFNNQHFAFRVKSRKTASDKPKNYLVLVNSDDSETYISSLYKSDEWTPYKEFHFDFEGVYYHLTIDDLFDKVAKIKKVGIKKGIYEKKKQWGDQFGGRLRKGINSTNAINNVELGTKIVPKW